MTGINEHLMGQYTQLPMQTNFLPLNLSQHTNNWQNKYNKKRLCSPGEERQTNK